MAKDDSEQEHGFSFTGLVPKVPGLSKLPGVGDLTGAASSVIKAAIPGVGKLPDVAALSGAAGAPEELPGAARIAGAGVANVLNWAVREGVETTSKAMHNLGSGAPVQDAIDTRVEQMRAAAWRSLGVQDTGEG